MKGKLVKRSNGRFDLYKIEDVDQLNTIASSFDNSKEKLSLKNCQAIERGYDLDELVNRAFDYMGYHSTVTPHEEKQFKLGYRVAFREALEILGDKKFSEEDMRMAFFHVQNEPTFDEFIQSLQQTEWDVEVEMECVMGCQNLILNGENSVCCGDKKPKLDADGCLILKLKSE